MPSPREPGSKAIVVHGDKICLVLRDNNPNIPHPNMWNTPGGAIEEGETPKEALIRELKEEINLDATHIIETGSTTYDDGSIVYRFFVLVDDEQFKSIYLVHEGQRLDWLTWKEILSLQKQEKFSNYFGIYLDIFANDIKEFLAGKREFESTERTLRIEERKIE